MEPDSNPVRGDTSNGVLLHASVCLPHSGQRLTVRWKAWAPADGEPLRWALGQLLASAGYPCKSKHTTVAKRLRAQKPFWDALLQELDWCAAEHSGGSFQSLARKRKTRPDDDQLKMAEQDFWVSTLYQVLLCLFWTEYKRGGDQQLPRTLAKAVFEKTLQADAANALIQFALNPELHLSRLDPDNEV